MIFLFNFSKCFTNLVKETRSLIVTRRNFWRLKSNCKSSLQLPLIEAIFLIFFANQIETWTLIVKFLRCWIYFISQKLSEISFKKFGAKGQYVLVLMAKFKHHIPIIYSFSSKFSRKENFEPGNLVKGFEFFFSVLLHPVSCVTFETGGIFSPKRA